MEKLLQQCHVPYTHLSEKTPKAMQRENCTKINTKKGCPKSRLGDLAEVWAKPRGIAQRNVGLQEVRRMVGHDSLR